MAAGVQADLGALVGEEAVGPGVRTALPTAVCTGPSEGTTGTQQTHDSRERRRHHRVGTTMVYKMRWRMGFLGVVLVGHILDIPAQTAGSLVQTGTTTRATIHPLVPTKTGSTE